MTIQEAKANVGKPFRVREFTLAGEPWDVIRAVTDDGVIIGDKIEVDCELAQLKQAVPDGFKRQRPDPQGEQALDPDYNNELTQSHHSDHFE